MEFVNDSVRKIKADNGREAKLWVRHPELIEDLALSQIKSMLESPRLFEHIAVMPDVHFGKGASIGAVMALDNAVVPNCVGVDIGCGMAAYPTGLAYEGERASRDYWRNWLGKAQRDIPTGFSCHNGHPKTLEHLRLLSSAERGEKSSPANIRCKGHIRAAKKFDDLDEMSLRQTGTMGGGNHFMEVQRDSAGQIWLMVHSGSRHIGYQIADHYAKVARAYNEAEGLDSAHMLHWLPLNEQAGQDYLHDMQWAVDYALLNRKVMLRSALHALNLEFDEAVMINIPHNYAAQENHFGKDVVVHRKGATSAKTGELGIIPGSMGTPSYIVKGLGNPQSYSSCSHGAGRAMGRKQAKRVLSTSDFSESLSGTFSKASAGYLDEAPQAYKNIDLVVGAQDELVSVVHRLEPVITLKDGQGGVD